jgi:hypothetical protein
MDAANADFKRPLSRSILPQCDPVLSNATVEAPFDKEMYALLRKRFLEKRVYKNEELPMGRVLGRKVFPPLIDTDQPGFKNLKSKIKELEKTKSHAEIFRLLEQLRDWQVYNRGIPQCMCDVSSNTPEIFNLTEEDPEIVDVDKHMLEVVLLKVVKPDPDGVDMEPKETLGKRSATIKKRLSMCLLSLLLPSLKYVCVRG